MVNGGSGCGGVDVLDLLEELFTGFDALFEAGLEFWDVACEAADRHALWGFDDEHVSCLDGIA